MTSESQKFDSFKDDWWNPEGGLKTLHRINPLRFAYFKNICGELKDKRVLDAGCGGGLLSESFAREDATVTGIDLSPVSIEAAKKHASESGLVINYLAVSISELKAQNPPLFDIVVCAEVLEHVDDVDGFLKDALSLLKKDGFFFFATINKTLKAQVLAITVAEGVGMVPKGAHEFKKFIRPSRLVEILEKNNVEAQEIKGMTLDPLTFDFKLSNDPSVNYLGYAVKR
ncbi:MAG: bifunctional 2-polyprenyl-6-hydroxyphenol methylase/3-demethylubiquinol 3-O-methyltransferase UbiG [Deltaproteobacteria bacterium]|nr:bifunctional 2-polyprenyl-6-hydroxyphenol methylase/3-demethylubiquinol 3-O-methyltransferase UbiG [Deltaproteobacteria bacterium]